MFLLVLILVWCAVYAVWSKVRPRLPSPPVLPGAWPLIGHTHLIMGDALHMWKFEKHIFSFCLKSGGTIKLLLGPHPVYVLADPDDCLTVANTCLNKPYFYNFAKEMYSCGLVTAHISTWKPHRRLLNPSFNQQVLNTFIVLYNLQARTLVNVLASKVGEPIDAHGYLINNLLKTVCRTSLGLNIQDQSILDEDYIRATEDLLELFVERLKKVWLHFSYTFSWSSLKNKQDALIKQTHKIMNSVITKRKLEMKESSYSAENKEYTSVKFKPLLDQMIDLADKQEAFTDDEIRGHIDTVVAAAFDTTASAMTYTLLLIGSDQKMQERIYNELLTVLGDQDRDLTKSDLLKLVYLEAVIKESLRLHPPVPMIARSVKADVKLKNYTLPAGSTCVICVYGINRHQMWGPDANEFKPERWLNPETLPGNVNAFATFSLGRRNCIGKLYAMMVMKTTLAHIVRQYRITADVSNVQSQCDIIIRPVTVDEQSTSTLDAEAATTQNDDPSEESGNRNGNQKMLRRMDTVPDIKRDTSGITTQYIATGIVNLGAFAAGVCVAWSSSALPLLTNGHLEPPSPTRDLIAIENTTPNILSPPHTKLTLTAAEASWVASLLCLGALWGAGPAGLISEYFGRKKTLLYLALPLVVSWILVASSPNVYGLYVGRFVGGMALGAFSVGIPPYVEDIAEEHILPTLANFYHVHFSCGVLFGYIIGLVENTSWLTVLCASVPTAFFIAFIFLPESPAYLMSQGKFHEAKAALRYFRGIDNDIDSEIKALKERIRNSAKIKVTFKELFGTRSNVKALIVSFGLMVFQQMSGIFPVLFYAKNIFETFAISLNPPSAAIIIGFFFVSSTYFSTMLLKVVRRRILLMISFAAMAVNLACLGSYYHLKASNLSPSSTWVPLFTLCLFVSFYASGVGPIPWLMLREIFPKHMTRRATALTAGFHWFLAFGVTKLYQNLIDMVKPGWTLFAFSITCLVGIVFVYFFVPETKGRSLEEIQNEFEGIHKKRKHRHVIEVESVSEA